MSRLFRRSRQSKHILFRMLRWLIVYLCLAGALSGKGSASVRGGGGGSSSNTACTGCVSAEAVTQPHRRAPVMDIDLGTTYSVVGIWRNGGVEIVPNELGNRITPSVVAFSGGERFVGDGAKHMIDTDPHNTISAVKRLMGRAFADPQVQRDRANFPYGITAGPRGEAVVSVPSLPNRHMTPQEVSAMVLQKMRHIAEEYAGEEIRNAVITVPAYFNEAQRRATQEAGAIAGLNVLRILNEPTAAAVAYGLDERYRKDGGEKTVVVYDLGGGTFDVSLLSMSTEDDFFEVLATSGDTHLGGEDLDSRLAQHMLELFRKAHPGVAPGSSATARLRAACEAAKRQLTARDTAVVEVPGFAEGIDLSEGITRAKFEQLAGGLLKATLRPLEDVLSQAGLQRSDVDEVVLVGGSTRIPKVRSMVREFFKKEPTSGVNPDEAVAYGAAVHAAVLSGEAAVDVVVVNVSPLSLGIETSGGIMSPILPRNTQLPATQSKMFSTTQDNQQTVRVRVYEGERARSSDCRLLGEFELTGIAPAPRGVAQIQVVFAVDENGILTVAAEDKATGRQVQTTITSDRRSLSEEEVRALVAEAEAAAGHDKEVRAAASARAELEGAAFQLKQSLADEGGLGGRVGSAALQELRGVAQSAISWLDDNPDATPAQCAEILAEMQNAARSAVGEGADPRMGDA